tara:strand:- start:203 stop:1657 length:1455 start_codon:yes stop_codon:yes gene_type:complete
MTTEMTTMMTKFDNYIQKAKLDPKPHQRVGVQWALKNETREIPIGGVRGGLVADEMGLGKTIVMIGTMVSNFKRRTLIVLPLALLDQWESEIIRTTGHQPLVYHGSSKKDTSIEDLAKAPIVLTTYGLIQTTKKEKEKKEIHEVNWDRVIFDEAHHLRNMSTNKFRGAKKIQAKIRWLITGTPIQNRKTDFYALCEIMGYESGFYTDENNLMEIVRSSILKRKKEQAGVFLPEKKERCLNVKWANKSEKLLAEDIHSMLLFSQVNVPRNIDNVIASMGNGTLPLLVRARQSCVYPKLMEKKIKEYQKMGLLENDSCLIEATQYSSKIDAVCKKIVDRKDNGKSKIVFCHYRGEIDIIGDRLAKKGLAVEKFDGRTSHSERNEILTKKCDVLILQIQTGCEGLNLQHFSEIYFVSPHWNPAVEDQAVARCHRIGQEKEVEVFRFQMSGFDDEEESITLDAYSGKVQEAKRKIYDMIDEPERIDTN